MTEPTKILLGGDTHGDIQHIEYYFDVARRAGAEALFVLGDFGYWEHVEDGALFLDQCSAFTKEYGITLYWLDGNHENHTMLRERYLDNPVTVDEWGFVQMREGLYHAPRALRWTWGGKRFLALGGAYSIDKDWRLQLAETNRAKAHARNKNVPESQRTDLSTLVYWWPEEEISDEEADQAAAGGKVDIMLVHDKPLKAKPSWNRKDYAECLPNQQRIQRVVDATEPELLVHGHLHFRYTDVIGSLHQHDDTAVYTATQVEGLDCNAEARRNSGYPYQMQDSWYLLDLTKD